MKNTIVFVLIALFYAVSSEAPVLFRNSNPHKTAGQHWTVDFFDLPKDTVNNIKNWPKLKSVMTRIIADSGMHILGVTDKHFIGGGVSAVWIISESHVSIHTWPEHRFAAVDVYTCGTADSSRIVKALEQLFKAGKVVKNFVQRGIRVPQVSYPQPPYKADFCVNGDEPDDWTRLANTTVLADVKSQYQRIQVIETEKFGRCMVLDGAMQYCMSDNAKYTRYLVDRPIAPFVGRKRIQVLIIGGADAWVANYLFDKYASTVERVTMVDLDKAVSQVTNKFFSDRFRTNAYKDPRVKWNYKNAVTWLEKAPRNKYDLVIIDCTDNTRKVSEVLYTPSFYRNIRKTLTPGGRVVQQMNTDSESLKPFYRKTHKVWRSVGLRDLKVWKVDIPSFSGKSVYWMASKRKEEEDDDDDEMTMTATPALEENAYMF